jgi:PAS domain S-box-containing protein
MNPIILDFEQARSKHLLFKSRLRSILYDIPVEEGPVLSHHECSVGKWIYGHALAAYGHIPEMHELEMVHADIHISARKLVAMHKEGRTKDARNGLSEMEAVADKLVSLLSIIETKLENDPLKTTSGENLDFKFEEYDDLLRSNAELDKRIQQQIAENNNSALKYETVMAALQEGIIIQDANGVLQSANKSAERLLGMSGNQLQGLTSMYADWGAIAPDGSPMTADQHAPMQALRTGKPFLNQLIGVTQGGKIVWLRVNSQPLIDKETGAVNGVVSSFFDVTDIRESETILKDSFSEQQALNEELAAANEEHAAVNEELASTNEELREIRLQLEDTNQELATSSSRLRMAIESTSLGTWEYNPVNGDLSWSKECRDIYGIAEDEPITFETFATHIHPSDRTWVQEQIEASMHPGQKKGYDLSCRIIRFDNHETRWIKVQGKVYFDNERATRFIGTVLDITDIKKAEEESAKLAAIIVSSDDAIISKTIESVITSWNNSAQRIFGYTAEEMIGESIYKLIPEDRKEEEPLILKRLSMGERVEHFETKRLTKDGHLIDVSVTVSPIKDGEGKIIGLSKIARDITEKKQDETRKSDFIGMVSHELKTPLTSLNAIIQVANAKLKNSEDNFLVGAMQKAGVQVKRMSTMINGFLNVSRLESASLLIDKQTFQLQELIADVAEEIMFTISSHHISFIPCSPVQVFADQDKISSVISNLIGNAVKYSPNGTAIKISCAVDKRQVVVSFKDEGIGIKPEDTGKIFDRYYRVEGADTKHISGFGIGLYLSAEIIRRHEGSIWVESESGQGSTFYFSLPLN